MKTITSIIQVVYSLVYSSVDVGLEGEPHYTCVILYFSYCWIGKVCRYNSCVLRLQLEHSWLGSDSMSEGFVGSEFLATILFYFSMTDFVDKFFESECECVCKL